MERLSRQDVSNLRIEARGLPMHVAGLAVLEGSPLRDSHGVIRLEAVRAAVGARLHMAPRLRQVLYRPAFGLGLPMWVDDAGFDIAEHVMVRAVPAPGDTAAFLSACQELNERPLDRSRPLWEMWLLTGISDGTVGMLIRLHHAVADGIATLGLLGSLFDFAPDAPAPVAAGPWIAEPVPSTRELLADAWGRRRAGLDRILTGLAHPGRLLRRLWAIGPLVQEFGEGLAPRSSLNGPIGTRHRLLIARADLGRAKAVARACGAKVNDVLTAVAAGARALLGSRGEPVAGITLRASVPVSMRGVVTGTDLGNQVALMVVPLPVDEPDPFRLLGRIARATSERRDRSRTPLTNPFGNRILEPVALALMKRQRWVNISTSNVPGPPVPMYFCGARVLEVFQVSGIQGNVRLGVGVLSYAGQLNFNIVGDERSCPDLAVFVEGLTGALEQLGASARYGPFDTSPEDLSHRRHVIPVS